MVRRRSRDNSGRVVALVFGILFLVAGVPLAAEGVILASATSGNSFAQSTGLSGLFEFYMVAGIVLSILGAVLVWYWSRGR